MYRIGPRYLLHSTRFEKPVGICIPAWNLNFNGKLSGPVFLQAFTNSRQAIKITAKGNQQKLGVESTLIYRLNYFYVVYEKSK